jgi:hypothetical protein
MDYFIGFIVGLFFVHVVFLAIEEVVVAFLLVVLMLVIAAVVFYSRVALS